MHNTYKFMKAFYIIARDVIRIFSQLLGQREAAESSQMIQFSEFLLSPVPTSCNWGN